MKVVNLTGFTVSLWHCHIGIGSVLVRNCIHGLICYVLLFFHCHEHCAEEILFFLYRGHPVVL